MLGFLIVWLFGPGAQARWAEVQNANFVVESQSDICTIHKDASCRCETELTIELLTDEARNDFGLYRLRYDLNSGHLKILDAATINPPNPGTKSLRRIAVNRRYIEDKALASSGPGFDQTNQITIPFPELRVGSKVHLKYEHTDRAIIPGYFGFLYSIGQGEYTKSYTWKLHSELPLVIEVHDPDQVLETKKTAHDFSGRLTRPLYRTVTEEENGFDDLKAYTWIGVTTLKDWQSVPKSLIQQYEERIDSPLPPAFEKILEAARAGKNDIEQMNIVTSLLQDQVRYVGDWRKVNGGYVPRTLALIADSGYGDCKDFSLATNAILRRLGFETHAAWIRRERFLSVLETQAAILNFNHAISFVSKNGHEFWIDPTNISSNAQGLYSDIENRSALVLYPTGAVLQRVPPLTVGAGISRSISDLKIVSDDVLKSVDTLSWSGQSAVFLTGWGLTYSKPNLDFSLLHWVADPKKIQHWRIEPYDMSSRIVHDITVKFDIEQSWLPIITTRGQGFALPSLQQVNYFNLETENRVSGLKLEDPYTWEREFRLTGRQVDMKTALNCDGDSAWIRYSRRFELNGETTLLRDAVTLKASAIPAEQLKTPAFRKMQKDLAACMSDAIVILK